APTAAARAVLAKGKISGNRTVTITRNGMATITSADHRHTELRHVPFGLPLAMTQGALTVSSAKALIRSVDVPKPRAFARGVINVIFRDGIAPSKDVASFSRAANATMAPAYSGDYRVNTAFAKLGVDRVMRIARSIDRSHLASMRSQVAAYDPSVLNLANAFQI